MKANKLIAVALLYDDGQYVAAKIRKIITAEVEARHEVALTFADYRPSRILRLEVELDMGTEKQAAEQLLTAGLKEAQHELPE